MRRERTYEKSTDRNVTRRLREVESPLMRDVKELAVNEGNQRAKQ